MEALKKFGLWIIAAVLVVGAVVFYILIVRNLATDRADRMKAVEANRTNLEALAKKANLDQIANPTWIDAEQKNTEQLNRQTEGAELYLANQPRWCHTRWFYDNELWGRTDEIRTPIAWLNVYDRYNEELRVQLANAALYKIPVDTLNHLWGQLVPQPAQIDAAMQYYWFQKDWADLLTGQAEKDLEKVILYIREGPNAFPAKPADLAVNRTPKLLDEFLRGLPDEDLRAVLAAILINRKQQDLAMIFNELLPEKFPWSRPPEEQDKFSVLGLTMDDEQRRFLERLVPAGKPDLFNNQRYLIFLRDLRTVRYRSDVVRMLENHGFPREAERLRKGTPEEYTRLLYDINTSWNRTKLAQAIAAVVSVKDEKDYELLKSNHKPQIEELVSYQFQMPLTIGGTPLGGSQSELNPEIYTTIHINMRVRIAFDRIPVFLRCLLNNNWVPDVQITRVTPVVAGTVVDPRRGRGAAPAGGAADEGVLDVGNLVWVDLKLQAHHFKPLLDKLRAHLAAESAAGTTER